MCGPSGSCDNPEVSKPADLSECNFYSDDNGPFCDNRGEKCRYKYHVNCPDYISIYLHQVKCDKINGTNFAEQLLEEYPDRRVIASSLQ